MARFLGGAALLLLGAAAADAGITFTMRRMSRSGSSGATNEGPHFPAIRSAFVDASQALQSAVVFRAPPLSGERLRAAERGLERALEQGVHGDATRTVDIRLLLALLAARDGRFDEALKRYDEASEDDPSDLRPLVLSLVLCGLLGLPDDGEAMRLWARRLRRVVLSGDDDPMYPLRPLVEELVVAAALGSAPCAIVDDDAQALQTQVVMLCAADRLDAWMAASLRDEDIPAGKRLPLRAVRTFLQAKMGPLKASIQSAIQTVESAGPAEPGNGEEGDEIA